MSNVVNQLQFQDITGQQLKHIEDLLSDMNRRITQVVKIFSPPSVTFARSRSARRGASSASWTSSTGRGQAVADEIFAIRGRPQDGLSPTHPDAFIAATGDGLTLRFRLSR